MSKIKIGYQGMLGSNSYVAAQQLAHLHGFMDVQYIALVQSQKVVDALLKKEVDYGVLAIKNTLGGEVIETKNALAGITYTCLQQTTLQIQHHLYSIDESSDIQVVASHVQALLQCKNALQTQYPDAQWQELEDTAIGAKYISEHVLDKHCGVLCRHEAGQMYGLVLREECMQDDENNFTDFILIQ